MSCMDVYSHKTEFILQFIDDSDLGIEHLCDLNFVNLSTLNEVIKLGFDPNKWEERYPYSKILVEGKPYLEVT